ncbi:hypothetical protein [Desulfitobacterium sp.]|uniref:hypothetical protein n=1 Tax=Desulfitobacterium sp. TaxID=49981 RepID=UPI002C2123B5|nr:hypothetical protein [Desulfitobacterium sp.]HVJ47914.1 hypothetical protein [Desulfitobacterium sp.]
MYIAFPADKKVKARLDAVCKSLRITYEEWLEATLWNQSMMFRLGFYTILKIRSLGTGEKTLPFCSNSEAE